MHPQKFKKKIAELLRQVLAESREFAQAFAEQVDRTPKKKKVVEAQLDTSKIEIFEEGTTRFEDAMHKVSQGLLDVLYSQFGSKPQTLVAGGIVEESEESQQGTSSSDDGMFTDETMMDSLEEDDE